MSDAVTKKPTVITDADRDEAIRCVAIAVQEMAKTETMSVATMPEANWNALRATSKALYLLGVPKQAAFMISDTEAIEVGFEDPPKPQ